MPDTTAERPPLAVTGPVTRAEVEWWRGAILDGLSRDAPLRLDLSASGPWDLSGLQLLLSTLSTARTRGVDVRLVRVPRVMFAIAERAGLAENFASPEVVESRV